METIMAELKNVEWAQPLLREIEANGGLCGANMARFFELRQGYALRRAGIKPSYEIAGEGESTIDFGFTAKASGTHGRVRRGWRTASRAFSRKMWQKQCARS